MTLFLFPLVLPPVSPDQCQSDPTERSPSLEDFPVSSTVALENLPDSCSREVLVLLIENISGVSEEGFSLELVRESHVAVVTFSDPKGMFFTIYYYL